MPSLINLWFVCNSLSIYKLSILYCTIRLFKKDNYDNGDAVRSCTEWSGRRGTATLQVLRISTKAREPADWADRTSGSGPQLRRAQRSWSPTARPECPDTHHLQCKPYTNGNWTTARTPLGFSRSEIQPKGDRRCS